MIVTTEMLRAKNACDEQVELFDSLTGGSVDVTETWCLEHYDKFQWRWAAENLLPVPALAEYRRVIAPAWVEYERVTAPALAEYERVIAPAWAEYRRATAQVFGRLLNQ